jgi:pyruvate/2-oxoglutarate dehydrogenase complex dihydrolipoamide acyltransferase (E2) component
MHAHALRARPYSCIHTYTLTHTHKVNSVFRNGAAERLESVDVCVAVATPAGLITPIIKAADTKSLHAIAATTKAPARDRIGPTTHACTLRE